MPDHDFDVLVIGAGVVGLATAAVLAREGRSVVVVERADAIAGGVTARNSEVIHAGIYYEPGSLKAQLCVEGNRLLYERCGERSLPHRRVGKLIVATSDDEVRVLEGLLVTGRKNGAAGLELIDASAVGRLEPRVAAVAALRSPSTGIIDAYALSVSYLAECESFGGTLLLASEVLETTPVEAGWRVQVRTGNGERQSVVCGAVVNAAGLDSDRVAERAGLDVDGLGYRLHYCKGDYFCLAPGRRLELAGLIYPVPGPSGLGIHATLDLAGRVHFGPDTEYIEAPHYAVDAAKASRFATAVRRYLPEVGDDWLVPEAAGVRPKLAGPGEGFRDFVVREESDRGRPGWVNCVGIESPGLTAAPAIGRRVAALLGGL